MTYNIGQLRRNEITSYANPVKYTKKTIINDESIIDFQDICLEMSGDQIVDTTSSYYLKFEVSQRPEAAQDFIIKLKNNDVTIDNVQEVKTLKVAAGTGKVSFELIFNPNSKYNQLIFELQRLALDFYLDNGDGTSGRKMEINILEFSKIINIVDSYLKGKFSGLTKLKKIGLQGPPGLMFVLDGEEIRIGRTGVYELYNDNIEISYIGFIIKDSLFTQSGKDFFVMDFKY